MSTPTRTYPYTTQTYQRTCLGKYMGPPTSNYIVRIDDDAKFVSFHGIVTDLERIIKKYYKDNEIKITTLPYPSNVDSMKSLIKSLIKPNSFFNNNDFDADEFVEKINEYNKSIEYFNIKFKNRIEKPEVFNTFPPQISTRKSNEVTPLLPSHDIIEGYSENKYDEPMSLDEFNDSLLNACNKYNIYYNNQFNNIHIIKSCVDVNFQNTNMLFQEFSLLFADCNLSTNMEEQLRSSKEILVNEDDARSKINRILNETIIDSKLSINEMKELITKYFTITTNLENRVKFTNIWEIITSKLKISEPYVSYLKRQLPVILDDLKLQKKRYTDGIYWYGLVKKTYEDDIIALIKDNEIPIDGNTYENYLKKREAEIKDAIPPPSEVTSPPDEFLSKLLKK